MHILNDIQRTVQTERELLQDKMAELSAASARGVELRQRHVLWLTIAATASAVLLGLVVAALITDRLTQPGGRSPPPSATFKRATSMSSSRSDPPTKWGR